MSEAVAKLSCLLGYVYVVRLSLLPARPRQMTVYTCESHYISTRPDF